MCSKNTFLNQTIVIYDNCSVKSLAFLIFFYLFLKSCRVIFGMLIIKNKPLKNHETNYLYTDDLTDAVQTVDGKLHFNLLKGIR